MKLSNIFSNHMVLQANKPVRIFGQGDKSVKIDFAGNVFSTDSVDGKWEVILPAMSYGGPYTMRICDDEEIYEITDVMVGEVLLCAGQSNMQFTMSNENSYEINENPSLRIYVSDRIEAYEGIKSKDGWTCCDKKSFPYWSALGYRLAEKINKDKGCAVGIVGCYQGASNIQSWLPKEIAEKPQFFVKAEDAHLDYSFETYSLWNKSGKLFEHTFLPIVPYTFSSVIWYQGESNTSVAEGKIYKEMLIELINAWRLNLKDDTLPFVVVQICDLDERNDDGWHSVQNAQAEAVSCVKYAKLVTSSDVCEHFDIHPQHKERLAEKIFKVLF